MYQSPSIRRHGLSTTTMVALATGGAMVGTIAWLVAGGGNPVELLDDSDIYIVESGGFDISIPASGDLASLEIVSMRNQLEGTSTIMELIPEGSFVQEGDLLLKLDDETVKKNIENAEEALTTAKNQLETAKSNLEITQKRRDTNIAQAQLRIDLAELSLEAWEMGEVVSKRKKLELDLMTAEKDYKRLKGSYEKSLELKERDFISQNELDQDEISMIRAKSSWEQAVLAKDVYENYTHKKEEQLNNSELTMAQDEYTRIVRREDAGVRSAESSLEAYKEGFQNRTDRLEKYRLQETFCEVHAPSPGLVVFGTSVEDWREDNALRVGTKVSRNELLFILPDNTKMAAELSVNEALSGYVEIGQRATIVTDAIPDVVLEGKVISVGVLAEDGGWRDPNRRDYQVKIELHGEEGLPLKPSMRCKGRIYIDRIEASLFVPVHAVGREGMTPFLWVATEGGYEQREIVIGDSSELFVVIEDGLVEGEQVLLREPLAGTVARRLGDKKDMN